MKTTMKLMIAAAIVLTLGLSAQAGVFSVDSTNTTVQKVNGDAVDTHFAANTYPSDPSYLQPKCILGYTAASGATTNREAFVWSAPAGQQIVKINFDEEYSGDPAIFQSVVYNLSSGALTASTIPAWTSPAPSGYTFAPREITFSASAGVTSIGFGFITNNGYLNEGWMVGDDNIVVTTAPVPEPSALALLAVAGLLILNRKRKTR